MKRSFLILVALSFVIGSLAYGGECKVYAPAKETLVDALTLARLNEMQLEGLGDEFKQKTGKPLKVVIVGRAGQDLSNLTVLNDFDQNGQALSLSQMVQWGVSDSSSSEVSGEGGARFSPEHFKGNLRKRYSDPNRRMDFSHIGFMIANDAFMSKKEDGSASWWTALHMLRPCSNPDAKSEEELMFQKNLHHPYIWRHGPAMFFADDPHQLNVRYIVPTPAIQDRLIEILSNGELLYRLNSKFYNAAAAWNNLQENNSNQFVLEVLAAAMQPKGRVDNRSDAQAVLSKARFIPSKIVFSGMASMASIPGARLIKPEVTLHSNEQPFYTTYGVGEIITALSVEEFMVRNGLVVNLHTMIGPEKTKRPKAQEPAIRPMP